MERVTSLANQRIKLFSSLNEKKYRDKYSLFVVEEMHLIDEAYQMGLLETLIVRDDCEVPFEFSDTIQVNEQIIKKISNTTSTNKYLGIVRKPDNKEIGKRCLLLDNVQDPGNVGTIVRTACCFGFDTIILSKGCADPFSSKVIRSSQGAIFKINIIVGNLPCYIESLKKKGAKVYATALKNSKDLEEFSNCDSIAIVLGNEGNGVSQEVIDQCEDSIRISINNFESLNVAVAAGIVCYHFRK